MKIQKVLFGLLLLSALVLLASCSSGTDVTASDHIAGFWSGIWHGLIWPFSFIGSWFSSKIHVWESNNNGGWYITGFIIGVWAWFDD